jgi:hypothetical protein
MEIPPPQIVAYFYSPFKFGLLEKKNCVYCADIFTIEKVESVQKSQEDDFDEPMPPGANRA